jgi:diguanylate cyclase (GGDEF)-like protein
VSLRKATPRPSDLDHFKEVNDRFGHARGDDLLVQITRRLQSTQRPSDAIGRIGGDEFLVLYTDTPEGGLPSVRERLLAAFGSPFDIDGTSLTITASVGAVPVRPTTSANLDDLFQHADRLMYQAKAVRASRRSGT